MVRIAVAEDYLLSYLESVAEQNPYSVGLLLGQSCLGKDYVIHFAKTPPFPSDDEKNNSITDIADINENWVADHARQVTRMLPGGTYVVGIFLVSPDDLHSPFNSKLKSLLQVIHKQLDSNKYLFGNCDKEKLVLNYVTKTRRYSCKTYDVLTSNVQPAEFKFLQKTVKWYSIESTFQIDQLHYLKKNEADWPLQKHIKVILDELYSNLNSSIFLFDNEFRDGDDNIESIGKKKSRNSKGFKGGHDVDLEKPISLGIFQKEGPDTSDSTLHKIIDTCGQLRIVGQVVSKLWLQSKLSINQASDAAKQDIMRSLAARLEMHLDSLTEEENSEDINCVHEPPRRVLISLPQAEVTFSDYLFPGEGPQDAKVSLEELLDIKMSRKLKIQDVEGQADITEYYNGALDSDIKAALPTLHEDSTKFLYLALVVALIVLIIALVLHFYK